MKEIKYNFILCVCENFCDTILLRFQNRNLLWFEFRLFDKLRFLFHRARSYGSYGSSTGSGSTTLLRTTNHILKDLNSEVDTVPTGRYRYPLHTRNS